MLFGAIELVFFCARQYLLLCWGGVWGRSPKNGFGANKNSATNPNQTFVISEDKIMLTDDAGIAFSKTSDLPPTNSIHMILQ